MISKGFEQIGIKYLDIKLDALPASFSRYKIIHIADLHISKRVKNSQIISLIDQINSIESDIVVITGDLIDAPIMQIKEKLQLFTKLNKPLYFVSGNHELLYAKNSVDALCKIIDAINLDNSKIEIAKDNESITLMGFSDRYSRLFGKKREINHLFKDNSPTTILLAHQPKRYKHRTKT